MQVQTRRSKKPTIIGYVDQHVRLGILVGQCSYLAANVVRHASFKADARSDSHVGNFHRAEFRAARKPSADRRQPIKKWQPICERHVLAKKHEVAFVIAIGDTTVG